MATVETRLVTAAEYLELPDDARYTELVRGEIVEMNLPTPRHGQICWKTGYLPGRYLEDHPVGQVVSNDSAVLTNRDPDTVRGADVAFYSYQKIPPRPLPQGYLEVVPELVFEVRSPTDRWAEIYTKVSEYLDAGVQVVRVLDEQTQTAYLFSSEQPPRQVNADEELTFPQVLAHYRVPVRRFFE